MGFAPAADALLIFVRDAAIPYVYSTGVWTEPIIFNGGDYVGSVVVRGRVYVLTTTGIEEII